MSTKRRTTANKGMTSFSTNNAPKKSLMLAIRLLSSRLDLLKVRINDLDTSCISIQSSATLAQLHIELNLYKICRKKLLLVIHLVETLYEKLDEEYNVDISRAMDSVFWGLKFIKEHLALLTDSKPTQTIEQIEEIIKFANEDIRLIALNLIEQSIHKILNTPLSVVKIEPNVKIEMIDLSLDNDNPVKPTSATIDDAEKNVSQPETKSPRGRRKKQKVLHITDKEKAPSSTNKREYITKIRCGYKVQTQKEYC